MKDSLFSKLGRKFGTSLVKGKWYYQSIFGSPEEAIKAERLMGSQLAKAILEQSELSRNRRLKQVVLQIKNQLITRVTDPNRTFQVGLLSSGDLNAFALPGGYIFVSEGLCLTTGPDQNEIAFVLAHEIIHVMRKHPFNRIVAEYSSKVVTSLLSRRGALPLISQQIVTELLSKSYSRDKEFEADAYAIRLMYSAGFNPFAACDLLNRLREPEKQDPAVFSYFSTHPSIDERIQKIENSDLFIKLKKKQWMSLRE